MKPYNEPLPNLQLDKNRFRVKNCPCGKSNKDGKFVPYVGHETKGYCHSCGETFLPELAKVENWNNAEDQAYKHRPVTLKNKPTSYIPVDVLKATFKAYNANNFVKYLVTLFGVEITKQLIDKFSIATSNYWNGATIFWQKDIQGKIRTGRIIQFEIIDSAASIIGKDCKRNKSNLPPVYWVHSALNISDFEQCLFGEHLLIDKTKPVAIVESEKTVIIASIYLPEYIWLATGGKDGLTAEKCSILAGRTVKLFPDLGAFDDWSKKAKKFFNPELVEVSDLLERIATEAERKEKLDIADYLIRVDFLKVIQSQDSQSSQTEAEITALPTKEELQYSKMANRNPYVEMLVNKLGLVSATTGKPLMKF